MKFILHQDGTISVSSSDCRKKKRAMIIFDSELEESGKRKNAIHTHLKRYHWRQSGDRYSVCWIHPLRYKPDT